MTGFSNFRAHTSRFGRNLSAKCRRCGAEQETSMPNFDFGFTLGDQFNVGDSNKFGYLASLSYKNNTTFYDNTKINNVDKYNVYCQSRAYI